MKIIRGKSIVHCIAQAAKLGLGVPDYCLKMKGRCTFGYLIK